MPSRPLLTFNDTTPGVSRIIRAMVSKCRHAGPDDPDPEKEPDMPKQASPSGDQEQEEEDEDGLDPAAAAKKAKQLARKGITFSAKDAPKVAAV